MLLAASVMILLVLGLSLGGSQLMAVNYAPKSAIAEDSVALAAGKNAVKEIQ